MLIHKFADIHKTAYRNSKYKKPASVKMSAGFFIPYANIDQSKVILV
jgi:hypothetical protein